MTLFRKKYRVESTRLCGWDYSAAGGYFVTICAHNRKPFFGEVVDGEMQMSAVGRIAHQYWVDVPVHFPHVTLDEFIIMPNHVHGIILIHPNVETRHVASLPPDASPPHDASPPDAASPHRGSTENRFGPLKPGSLSKIVQAYKSAVSRWCRQNGHPAFAWQPRFYDHIVRNDQSLDRIRQYIRDNPLHWDIDRDNPANLYM